jgi:CRP-like cAMP-binding protein
MTAEEHKKMLQTGRKLCLSKGQVLFRYGDSASVFYLITSGKIKLHRTSVAGRKKVFKTCSKGDSIAVMMMFIPNNLNKKTYW